MARALTALAGLALLDALPSVTAIGSVRAGLGPLFGGRAVGDRVALTFDDGPDPVATPRVLACLAELDVRATFFVLGSRVVEHPSVLRQVAEAGHDVAVHGWTHRPHLLQTPWGIPREMARTVEAITSVTGRRARFWRPPNGIPTTSGLLAARRLGLRPVLWSVDGHDWAASATPGSIAARVIRGLAPGSVVLLHDSDVTSAAGSWERMLAALPGIVAHCRDRGWPIGPLSSHALAPRSASEEIQLGAAR